jgi:hypothetical protein
MKLKIKKNKIKPCRLQILKNLCWAGIGGGGGGLVPCEAV